MDKRGKLIMEIAGFLTIASLIFSLMLMSYNMTGQVISNLSLGMANFFGLGFFAVGVLSFFIYLKVRPH